MEDLIKDRRSMKDINAKLQRIISVIFERAFIKRAFKELLFEDIPSTELLPSRIISKERIIEKEYVTPASSVGLEHRVSGLENRVAYIDDKIERVDRKVSEIKENITPPPERTNFDAALGYLKTNLEKSDLPNPRIYYLQEEGKYFIKVVIDDCKDYSKRLLEFSRIVRDLLIRYDLDLDILLYRKSEIGEPLTDFTRVS